MHPILFWKWNTDMYSIKRGKTLLIASKHCLKKKKSFESIRVTFIRNGNYSRQAFLTSFQNRFNPRCLSSEIFTRKKKFRVQNF